MVVIKDPHDRRQFTPRHVGPRILPLHNLFYRMVRFADRPHLVAVKDLTFGFTADFAQLLTDVLHLRNNLQAILAPSVLERLDNNEEVLVNILGPGGYEYTVAFLAIFALGAVIVPLSADLPVKEATSLASRSRADAVLCADSCRSLGTELAQRISTTTNPNYRLINVRPHIMRPRLEPEQILVSGDHCLNDDEPGIVIFTSGTTGPPKGAVKRRGNIWDTSFMVADQYGLSEGDVVLHTLPVHHATGIGFTLVPYLLIGGCIEFRSGGFDTAWTWERIRQGGLNYFSGVPTIYMRLMQYYETHLVKLPPEKLNEYVKGIRGFKALLCGTSALPRPLQQKWTKLRDGKAILTRYGGTEFGSGFQVPLHATNIPEASVGQISPGVDLKLSDGDEGEVLIKSPLLFSKYLFDPEATANAHDADGYFKTGDIARREGKHYFIMGRASVDIIKSGGYKLSALDIEREILGLPYISEVMVVGVDDEEYGQRVGAVIVLRNDQKKFLTLQQLRRDLRTALAGYKMPTLLRVVDAIEKNATGKVTKKTLGPQMFPAAGHPDIQVWHAKRDSTRVARL